MDDFIMDDFRWILLCPSAVTMRSLKSSKRRFVWKEKQKYAARIQKNGFISNWRISRYWFILNFNYTYIVELIKEVKINLGAESKSAVSQNSFFCKVLL